MPLLYLIILLIMLMVLYAIGVQRKLVNLDELTANALSQIGVQQNSRWDALTALADLTKGYSKHEYDTLMSVINQRKTTSGNSSTKELNQQETLLTEAITGLVAVAEAYPDLKASDAYIKTMDSLNTYENNVRMSRMVYNDTVTKMNRLVRQFPSSIFAGLFGFSTRDYLQEPTGKTEMPSII